MHQKASFFRIIIRIPAISMTKNFNKLPQQFLTTEPPEGLFEQVMNHIQKEQGLLRLKRQAAIFALSTTCSAIAFIPAWRIVWAGFAESGFIQFFSLLFSDFEIVVTYWQNFALSLLETLPVMSLIILFVIILVFLESLKLLIKDIKIISTSTQKLTNT